MRLHDWLDYYGRERPDADWAICGDRRLRYGEAAQASRDVASALIATGIDHGERVGVLSKNSLEFALLYYGCSRAGVVPVPLNYRLAPGEWAAIAEDAGAVAVFTAGSELVDGMESVRHRLPAVREFIAIDCERAAWTTWDDWLGRASGAPLACHVESEDTLYQMYTSGTTGMPKGARVSHRAVWANITQLAELATKDCRFLITLPLYHAGAAISLFLTTAQAGCSVIHADFNPTNVVRALDEDGITTVLLVPSMIQACLVGVPDIAERKYATLETIIYGASPIAEETLRNAMRAFGCSFFQSYGMTEATAGATLLSADDHRVALGGRPELLASAGRPLPGTELRVVDGDDHDVPTGTVGEVLICGPQLMTGYWNRPEDTAAALRDGWMHTGDAALMDEDGYVYIRDRVKDMIVSGGENVYPNMVESALFEHPAIADVAVIGVPDERWGEHVHAVVVVKEGEHVTPDEVMDFCRGRIGGFERPRSVEFVDTLPRNATGKVLKTVLREPHWAGHTRAVSGA